MKMPGFKVVLLILLAVSTAVAAGNGPQADSSPKKSKEVSQTTTLTPAPAADAEYRIGKEDILSIQVWREPELSRLVAVRADGKISIPLVGELEAVGHTPLELQNQLTRLLEQYMKSPQVLVTVQDARSQRFSILGEVMRPGTYPLVKPTTILDALSMAGGFREFAKTEKMFVLRTAPDGTRIKIPVAYKKIISAKGAQQNIELEVRDTLVVP